MIGINLEFEKDIPFPLGKKPVMKDRPATVKDYRVNTDGYRYRLSYRTLDTKEEIYRVWVTEKYRLDKLPNGKWDWSNKHEHKRIATSNWEDEIC